MVPNCLRCQIVHFYTWCQIVRGAKLSAVPNCPGAKLSGAKLSAVPNCPVPNCPGAKLSVNMGGAKLSAVPNCPGAKLSRHPWTNQLHKQPLGMLGIGRIQNWNLMSQWPNWFNVKKVKVPEKTQAGVSLISHDSKDSQPPKWLSGLVCDRASTVSSGNQWGYDMIFYRGLSRPTMGETNHCHSVTSHTLLP